MPTSCKGVCIEYKGRGVKNSEKYSQGQKRCTYCSIFLIIKQNRCPCCKTILRTKPRGRRRKE